MATYKLIQDIEAEDKILGPLTLRQFIFALISIFMFYICFILVTKHVLFMLVIFLPPALFFGFFALPFGRDQPTEIWALAKLRYWFKPRRRIWDQSGVKELVTITVPKKVERVLSNGLSQIEVKSRLQALANTIDSRGWAIKNVDAYVSPTVMSGSSDRLLDIGAMPQAVSDDDIVPADDMLDAGNNPIAQQFESMITRSSRDHRQQLMDTLNDVRVKDAVSPAADYWFMNGTAVPAAAAAIPAAVSIPAPVDTAPPETPAAPLPTMEDDAGEAVLSAQLHAQSEEPTPYENMRTVQPLASGPAAPPAQAAPPAVTPAADPAILSLANNDDFNVATLAREARKAKGNDGSGDEVVIPLH